ncbi:MAG: UbiA family prenyltransferase [Pseudomonadota bacterium]
MGTLVSDISTGTHELVGQASPDVPLIVDMDGTLVRTDTLHEAVLNLIADRPLGLFEMVGWLRLGKAGFKAQIADRIVTDANQLPYREAVIEEIELARSQRREVYLVSASNQSQVSAVAEHLGIFDEAIGSCDQRNLLGDAKADYLVERFGVSGFDYIGDSNSDVSVWTNARRVITAGASDSVRQKAAAIPADVQHLDPRPSFTQRLRHHIKAMRPHQWLKNGLVFLPALAAHDPSAFLASFIAFVAFSLTASSIYIINDLLDLRADRAHPRKRNRPFAAGVIPVSHGLVQSAGLIAVALAVSLFLPPLFLAVLAGYVVLTFAYSLHLKRKLMIDIWTLGALYTVRMIAGAAASGVPLSEWLMGFSMFLFLSLAAIKRQSELRDLIARGEDRTSGRAYTVKDMPVVLGVVLSAGYCSVLVLALYVSNATASGLYSEPRLLWLVCPLLLYWISRATIISFRGEMDDDPILFAVRDKISLGVFVTAAALIVLAATL